MSPDMEKDGIRWTWTRIEMKERTRVLIRVQKTDSYFETIVCGLKGSRKEGCENHADQNIKLLSVTKLGYVTRGSLE